MTEIICGAGSFMTTLGIVATGTLNMQQEMICAVVSAIVFFLLNLVAKIVTSVCVKKGWISKEDKKDIDNQIDDFTDDGKLNGSNKKDK